MSQDGRLSLVLTATTFRVLLLASFLMLGSGALSIARAQERKVANYSSGKAGTQAYERLSFWVEGGKRGEVVYAHGEEASEDTLTYVEARATKGPSGFKVRLPDGHILSVIPKGLALQVADEGGDSKLFRWEYEGPVGGRGTWCGACAEDEREAMRLVRRYYLR